MFKKLYSTTCRVLSYLLVSACSVGISVCAAVSVQDRIREANIKLSKFDDKQFGFVFYSQKRDVDNFYDNIDHGLIKSSWEWLYDRWLYDQ